MKSKSTIFKLITILKQNISRRDDKIFGLITFFVATLSIYLEVLLLSAVYSVTSELSNGQLTSELHELLILFVISLLSIVLKISTQNLIFRLANKIGSNISITNYDKLSKICYDAYIQINKSSLITKSTTDLERFIVHLVTGLVQSIYSVVSLSFLLGSLIITIGHTALIVLVLLGLFYTLFVYAMRPFTKKIGNNIRNMTLESEDLLHNTLDNYKLTLTELQQQESIQTYATKILLLRNQIANISTMKILPKNLIEGGIFSALFAISLFVTITSENYELLIPVLGTLAIGLQKLAPHVQYLYSFSAGLGSYSYTLNSLTDIQNLQTDYAFNNQKNSQVKDDYSLIINNLNNLNNSDESCNLLVEDQFTSASCNRYKFVCGTTYCLIGPSGSGKSTMLDSIALLRKIDGRDVFFNGVNVNNSSSELIRNWRKNITYLVQNPVAYLLSVEDFIQRKASIHSHSIFSRESIFDALSLFDCSHLMGRSCKILSGGELQRVNIVCAYLRNSPIILMDECTSALPEDIEIQTLTKLMHKVKNSLVISISHRPHTYNLYDHIYEL